ncbi:hypothetical protein B4U79_08296 [Dinothrombium tinctorium]|uniref:XK-related protein n=1 Tax=Dinothrombium tinctorium TaxID=1965070 RepID=A0A443RMY2_9ACAR|nr:hypothetical protein B4U79_09638 [Dinothrombium tinctorium]RWS16602.1 hypothetical protein B4U79_08296 [Dinothrombium tinctorium]
MVALDDVGLREHETGTSLNFISATVCEENNIPMNLQQHHFGGNENISSPTLHNMGSLGRKVNNHNGGPRSYQRLSTFRPLQGQHADLVRECIEDRLGSTTPTYETIDPHHLSHLGYSADYGTASGSGCSSGSSLGRASGCIDTILPDARCYGTVGRTQLYHGGSHQNDYHPVQVNHHDIHHIYGACNKKIEEDDDEFTFISALFTLISLLSYLVDAVTDAILCYLLYWEGNYWWFGLTVAFTIIPSITVNAFSMRW